MIARNELPSDDRLSLRDKRKMPVDKSSERVRRMFGQIARRYDFLNHLLSLGIDHWWRRQTVRLVPPLSDTALLVEVEVMVAPVRLVTVPPP